MSEQGSGGNEFAEKILFRTLAIIVLIPGILTAVAALLIGYLLGEK